VRLEAGVLVVASDGPLDAGELTRGESAQLAAVPGVPRQRSWLTARRALRRGLAGHGLPTDTARYRFPSRTASLSHSAELAVAAVAGADPAIAGIGVDIELDRTPDERAASFYLTTIEQEWLSTLPAPERPPALLRLWTVKEALFKADPGNAATVLRDYALADPAAMRGHAVRAKPGGPTFCYVSFALTRGFLSAALALSPLWRMNPVQNIDFDQMAARISSLISVPVERLTPESTVAELVPDSFMYIEIAVDLQEEYGVVLSQDDLKEAATLGDLAQLIQRQQSAQAGDGAAAPGDAAARGTATSKA
jgi:acyl carrier protein